jgi:hypothetical protein
MVSESACENVAIPKESVMIGVVALAIAVELILVGVVGLVG